MNLFLILALFCASFLEGQGRPTGVSTVVVQQPTIHYSSFVHHNPFVRLSPLPATYVQHPLVYPLGLRYRPLLFLQPLQVLQPPAATTAPPSEKKPDSSTATVTVPPPPPVQPEIPLPQPPPVKPETPPPPPPDYLEGGRPEEADLGAGAIVNEDGSVDSPVPPSKIVEVDAAAPEVTEQKDEKPEVEGNAQDDDDTVAVESLARKEAENDDPENE